MHYHFKIHKNSDGLWAECVELDGCQTEANTIKELNSNMFEVLNLYLDEPANSAILFPFPKKNVKLKNIVKVPVEPRIAFAITLRNYRKSSDLTQSEMAKRLGMKNIYSYQRLERKSNPSLSTLKKLKNVFPDLSVDYILQI